MKIKFSLSLKIALLVMIVSLLGIATLAYISYQQSKDIFIEHTAQIVSKNIDSYASFIKENIQKLKYNITIFSYNPSVKGFMRSYFDKYKYDEKTNKTFNQYKRDITTIINLMMKQNPAYFQMRIIDATNGKEIIKMVKTGNRIFSIESSELQNKWKRDYVQDTLRIKDDIYISKIDLNKEFNTIEFPIKPTIRIAKIIYANNKKAGIAVINANIKKLFNFDKLKGMTDSKTFIANEEGYYIFNPTNPEKEFGFEFGRDYRIYYDFPYLKEFFKSKSKNFSFIDENRDKIIEARKVEISPNRYLVILKETSTTLFKNKFQSYMNQLIISIIVIALVITLITMVMVFKLTKPIKRLTEVANKIAKSKGTKHFDIDIKSNDEIGELANSFKLMLSALEESRKEIEDFANRLEREVEKKTKELQKINKNLQEIVEEKVKEIREKDKALVQQSKMAAMGEMIGAIAHQWRQPLNSLAINIQMLEDMYESGELNEKSLDEFIEKNMQTIQFMSNTIDDFRNFFRKDKEAVKFNIKEAIEKTISLQKAQLQNHNIKVILNLKDAYIKGYKNEFMQAILNIISNAKDAIDERRKRDSSFEGRIEIENEIKDDKVIIYIRDNGGGIKDEIKERIFEPYFTTKEEGKGTGMGLYMVKEIIERMNGKITFSNTKEGVEFKIVLRLENGKDKG